MPLFMSITNKTNHNTASRHIRLRIRIQEISRIRKFLSYSFEISITKFTSHIRTSFKIENHRILLAVGPCVSKIVDTEKKQVYRRQCLEEINELLEEQVRFNIEKLGHKS